MIVLSPASSRHQDLCDFLAFIPRAYAGAKGPGMELKRAREPGIPFVAEGSLGRLEETHLEGPADLAVGVVSPESRLRDRGEKFAEYEPAGVWEDWVIDPDEKRADLFVLGPDGRYERRREGPGGVYRSEVLPGFWLDVGWLWGEPLPRVLEVLRELGLI